MRLDRLKIKGFKNLRDFEVDFDETSPYTVLVGQNGSGKSNLIEALVAIFRNLDLGEPAPFGFELDYRCRGFDVRVEAEARGGSPTFLVDGRAIAKSKFMEPAVEGRSMYLPRFVFGYYSGPSNRLQGYFEKHQEQFYRELIRRDRRPGDLPLRPLFCAQPLHGQFVLLAFYSQDDPTAREFLEEHLGILGLDSILFVMKEPPWDSKDGDPRFWNAYGTVQEFLDRLFATALAPMRLGRRIELGFRKTTNLEYLYLFIKDAESFRDLVAKYGRQQDFFKTLESTYISELLVEVKSTVRVPGHEGSITYRELSEGEQQLLLVLGLLRFTREDESLFLLDEPDTHLNPVWSVQYLSFIEQIVGPQLNSHIVMATHDPLVFAGLRRNEVRIMRHDPDRGKVIAEEPDHDPRGMGVAAILTSDLFRLRSTLDLGTQALLDERRGLVAKVGTLTEAERGRLQEINQELRGMNFTHTIRDPLYERFVEAWARLEDPDWMQQPDLTPEQREAQKELAARILRDLTAGEAEGP